jgi:hypothetical protein
MPPNAPSAPAASRERVIFEDLGPLLAATTTDDDLASWPSGDFLVQALLPKYADQLPSTDPQYWQTGARKALLTDCGFLPKEQTATIDATAVQQAWEKLATTIHTSSDEDHESNDLIQFFRAGGLSNHRKLQWALMDCAPGCQFHLHAHPNLELVYCIKGELHEIRLQDDDNIITKSFEPMSPATTNNGNSNKNPKLRGPSLIGCPRPWRFGTLEAGRWLVNRVGTIHKSFTATNGEGCILLTLWGGSHANINDEPVVVANAVETMEQKLQTQCAGCHPTADELQRISETFLPESERSPEP